MRLLIECPVCLNVPRGTRPIPVTSNGHIVCHPSKDRIRRDTLLIKCPSCMVDLGNDTSLIALRLVEKVRHECENDGCEEMFNFLSWKATRKSACSEKCSALVEDSAANSRCHSTRWRAYAQAPATICIAITLPSRMPSLKR